GNIVEGTVVSQSEEYLLVNIGLKHEAAIPIKEFNNNIPKAGEIISVLVLRMSGPEGRPLVSWRQARERKNWDVLQEKFQKQEIIDAKIVQKIKGGFIADIGLDAFLPTSQIELRPIHNHDDYLGKTIQVQILEMDKQKGNVLISRRKILEGQKAILRTETIQKIKIGQIITGKVTGITTFGAFIDIGGIEGLLHVSDMDWIKVDNPQKVVKVGQELQVKVIKFDTTTQKVSLSRKELLPHPWEGIEKKFPIGTVIKGKVTSLADFGAFVEIESGIEGLIHVSELSWTERHKKPHGILKVGQVIEAKLIGIEKENEKISLSIRRLGENPWEKASKAHPVGSKLEGEVTHLAAFGAFVRIPEGIEALLKTQDISWTEKIQSPQQKLKVGDKISAVVLEVNAAEEKMSIGLKQLEPDPIRQLKVGQEITGNIVKVLDFGVFVKLPNGLDGLVRMNELTNERSMFDTSRPKTNDEKPQVKEGDLVTAVVSKILKKERKIELSVRKYEKDQERQLLKKYSNTSAGPTLGDALGWQDEPTKKS
ncbi:MAG: 30S ribosomal protein S1, partial [Elusimicrobiota bacterium]